MNKRNENRQGYKKTKVGWIPEEWKCLPLKSLCLKTGEYGANASAIPYSKEHSRYIRITDITKDGHLNKVNMKSIDSTISKNYLLYEGDFLFARSGATVGKTYLHISNGHKCAYAGYLIRFVPNSKKLLGNYLKAFTSTPRYWYWVQTTIRAGAQPNINAIEYSLLNIPLPPLSEQTKITEILSIWDRAIEQVSKLIDAKQRLKKGLMQKLLTGRMRFPEFDHGIHGIHGKKKGELPEGWEEMKLGTCFKEHKETNPDLPLLAITSDRGVIPRGEVERKDTSNADKSKYKRIAPGDIGYNTMRMWQGVSAVSTLEGIVSPAYTICTPKKGYSSSFFGYLFKYPPMIHLFHRFSQGLVSDTLNLKFRHFSQVKANIPSEAEQTRIAAILCTCDREIELMHRKETALHEQKKGLMQKLLTGEVRVQMLGNH